MLALVLVVSAALRRWAAIVCDLALAVAISGLVCLRVGRPVQGPCRTIHRASGTVRHPAG